MDTFNRIVHSLLTGYFQLFAGAPPLLALAVLSAVAGVAMLLVFGKTSDQRKIRETKRRLQAHLMELRLFSDEPAVMFQAQVALLRANLQYVRLMLRPFAVMALPMMVLLVHLEGYYGKTPLPVNQDTIVTVSFRQPIDLTSPPPKLEAPVGISVETPGSRVLAKREVSWRIRALTAASGQLRLVLQGRSVEKSISSGVSPRFVSERRVSGLWPALWNPAEPQIVQGGIDWIEVRYPPAKIGFGTIHLHWLVWFLLISMCSAFLLRKRLGVMF
jgi:uncharacterized membrane protein (DUF106 family)